MIAFTGPTKHHNMSARFNIGKIGTGIYKLTIYTSISRPPKWRTRLAAVLVKDIDMTSPVGNDALDNPAVAASPLLEDEPATPVTYVITLLPFFKTAPKIVI